ncbi:MAG TPA: response regulator [Beijerinckiaceae bacterium]|nr:response regulator [Beijerinckiaceae bacterium]
MDATQKPRALIVEDEIMVAMHIEDLLTELGCEVVLLATSLDQALFSASEAEIDFAVLDINLGGRASFPVAAVLRERGIPFLFASGYGSKGVEDGYKDEIRVQKPFRERDLAEAIARLGPARGATS